MKQNTQVDAAAALAGDDDCPAVLVKMDLVGAGDECASDINIYLRSELEPRDIRTSGTLASSADASGTVYNLRFKPDANGRVLFLR